MYQSFETVHVVVVFKTAAARLTDRHHAEVVTEEELLEVIDILHEWIRLLRLDLEQEEGRQGAGP